MSVMEANSVIVCTLSFEEMMTAAMVGARRQLSAMQNRRQHWGVLSSSETCAFDNHILGAMGELVVARTFNLFWPDAVGSVTGSDVGSMIEVRCRRPGNGPDLAMRPHDKPEKLFVLIHAEPPRFKLIGWLPGDIALRIGQLNEATGIRFVQATVPPLYPMRDLFGECGIAYAPRV